MNPAVISTCPLCGQPWEWSEPFRSWSCRPCRLSLFRVTRDPNGEPLIDFAMTERDYDDEVQSRFAAWWAPIAERWKADKEWVLANFEEAKPQAEL